MRRRHFCLGKVMVALVSSRWRRRILSSAFAWVVAKLRLVVVVEDLRVVEIGVVVARVESRMKVLVAERTKTSLLRGTESMGWVVGNRMTMFALGFGTASTERSVPLAGKADIVTAAHGCRLVVSTDHNGPFADMLGSAILRHSCRDSYGLVVVPCSSSRVDHLRQHGRRRVGSMTFWVAKPSSRHECEPSC